MISKYVLALVLSFVTASAAMAEESDLEITGVQVLELNDSLMKLQFRDEDSFIISIEKFKSQADAESFCIKNGTKLDKDGIDKVLLLAMSGAANVNPKIESAITFKLNEDTSGAWAWTGSNNEVAVIQDGHGMEAESVPFAQILKAAKHLGNESAAAVPAICQ